MKCLLHYMAGANETPFTYFQSSHSTCSSLLDSMTIFRTRIILIFADAQDLEDIRNSLETRQRQADGDPTSPWKGAV